MNTATPPSASGHTRLLEQIPVPALLTDPSGHLLQGNADGQALVGTLPPEGWLERLRTPHPGSGVSEVGEQEVWLRRADGSDLGLEVHSSVLEDGNILWILWNVQRRVAWRQRQDQALEAARVGFWDWDLEKNHITWSRQYARMMGFEGVSSLTPEMLEARWHPDDLERNRHVVTEAMLSGQPFEHIFRIVLPSSEVRWVHSHGTLERGLQGEPRRLLGLVEDITERIRGEQRMELLQRYTARLACCSSEAEVIAALLEDGLEASGASWTRLLRQEGEEVSTVASRLWAEAPPGDALTAAQVLRERDSQWQSDAGGHDLGPTQASASLHLESGPWRGVWALHFAQPQDFDPQSRHYLLTLGGLTASALERARLYDTALEREARLRELIEAQKRFVNDAAHELRAPLTAVQGNLELLERYPQMSAQDRQEALLETGSEVRRLARLVSDMLALARGDAGSEVQREPLWLDALARSSFASVRPLGQAHQLLCDDLPALAVLGDPDRLRQLLLVLLENAIKYTPPGGQVRLGLERRGEHALLSVRDSGIGIAPGELEAVFERFYRTDLARTRTTEAGGTGLGLSIAKWIVERHGGRIWLESEMGVGSVAWVALPLVEVEGED